MKSDLNVAFKYLSDNWRTNEQNLIELFENGVTVTTAPNVDHQPYLVKRFYIPKKRKQFGFRVVHKPLCNHLEHIIYSLSNYLNNLFVVHSSAHGFVKGRNIKSNATLHLHKKYILSVDIKDYFDSITSEMIKQSLIKHGDFINENAESIAEIISKIATIDNKLVQGYSSSPTLANLVSIDMDCAFQNYCSKLGIVYSRYADDLYFSSDKNMPSVPEIEAIINTNGFSLNPLKTDKMKLGQRQYVTGLSVFDKTIPRIPKKIKKNLRLEIHYISTYGILDHTLKKMKISKEAYLRSYKVKRIIHNDIYETTYRLSGWFKFIGSIEPDFSLKLRKHYEMKTNRDIYDLLNIEFS